MTWVTVVGLGIWLIGFSNVVLADMTLVRLRKPGETGESTIFVSECAAAYPGEVEKSSVESYTLDPPKQATRSHVVVFLSLYLPPITSPR